MWLLFKKVGGGHKKSYVKGKKGYIINNLFQEALFNRLFGCVNFLRNLETDDEDSEVEHCYGPGKLRAAKSINDMCDDQINNNSSNSRRYLYYVYVHISSSICY